MRAQAETRTAEKKTGASIFNVTVEIIAITLRRKSRLNPFGINRPWKCGFHLHGWAAGPWELTMIDAKKSRAAIDASGKFKRPIATEITPATTFYRAEEYHQDYLQTHTEQPYIVYNDLPKLEHLKKQFPELYH